MRNLFVLAFVGLGACGQTAGDQNTTPAPDTAAAPAPATRPDSQPAPLMDVTITTDTRTYRPGDPVELRITNSSARRFTFNPCTRTLEREDEAGVDRWSVVKEDRMCTMIAHVLEAKSTRTEKTELSEGLAPGRYRVVVVFTEDDPAAGAAAKTVRASALISVT